MLLLKDYQKQAIADLDRYVCLTQEYKDIAKAFRVFWNEHPRNPIARFDKGGAVEAYKNNIKGVPHVCLKVPTGGGKTLIACHAVRTVFEHYDNTKIRAVVWLVPSEAILTQTLNALRDTQHPYRQQLDIDFGGRVEVLDKNDLLQGVTINSSSVHEQVSVFVLMFQSFRSQNKDGRKAYQENSVYQSYSINTDAAEYALEGTDETASINVLRSLNPLVIAGL
jgi:type III restriction enzyme